jgi:transposase InsO family protein
MSVENSLWGAPRIHGELLKLGFEVSQSSVAKYMVKRRGPPSQGWRAFLRNHAPDIAAMDLFVVPTIGFELLYAFVIVRLDRRDLIWIDVTRHPTAEWIARQITEAFPWNEAPRYLIRDRDRIFGAIVTRRLRAMGIRDKPIAPASPWQNAFAERLIGSIRRECVDHIIVLGEAHLRRILRCYARYYNEIRTHRALNKDAPRSRAVQQVGIIKSHAILGGLHHQYVRIWFSLHTAFLFTMGKFLIGLYIGSSAVASSYGAAGALIVALLWIYYSAQIFLLGAEFTKVYAHHHGSQQQHRAR